MSAGSEILKEFVVALGFKDTGATKGIDRSLAAAATRIATFTTAAVTAGTAVFLGMLKIAEGEAKVFEMSERTGVAVKKIKELSYAAELLGSDGETAKASIEGFARAAGMVASGIGGRAKKAFDAIGVSVKDGNGQLKETTALMFEVGQKIKALPKGQQAAILSRLGMDRTMVGLITEGVGDLQDEMKVLFGGSEESMQKAAEAAHDFEKEWFRVRTVGKAIVKKAYMAMIGQSTESLQHFRKLLVANFEKITVALKKGVEAVGRVAGFVVGVLGVVANTVAPVFQAVVGWISGAAETIGEFFAALSSPGKAAVLAFGAALAYFLAPAYAVAAGIALLIGLVDDFQTYLRGGQSAFPEFWGTWSKALLGAWSMMVAFKDIVVASLKEIMWTALHAIDILIRLATLDFSGAKGSAKAWWGRMGESNKELDAAGGKLRQAAGQFGAGFLEGWNESMLGGPSARLGNLGPAPAAQTSQSVTAQTTINVSGVSDPVLAAQLVGQDQRQFANDVVRFMKPVVR